MPYYILKEKEKSSLVFCVKYLTIVLNFHNTPLSLSVSEVKWSIEIYLISVKYNQCKYCYLLLLYKNMDVLKVVHCNSKC